MRRVIALILLLAIAGLGAAVASAWIAASVRTNGTWRTPMRSVGNRWTCTTWRHTGWSSRRLIALPEQSKLAETAFAPPAWSAAAAEPDDDARWRFEDSAGWPAPCLWCAWPMPATDFAAPRALVEGGLPVRPIGADAASALRALSGGRTTTPTSGDHVMTGGERAALPLRPIARGLALSTTFWALVALAAVTAATAPASWRRRRRRRRGRCPRCGYDLGAGPSDTCPECNWAPAARAPAVTRGHLRAAGAAAALPLVVAVSTAVIGVARYDGPAAIHLAAAAGDAPRVLRELGSGAAADLPLHTTRGEYLRLTDSTPLMWAAAHGRVDMISLLLDRGARTDRVTIEASAALDIACHGNHVEAVRMLLERGASIPPGLLWRTTSAGHSDIACMLIARGADPNDTIGNITTWSVARRNEDAAVMSALDRVGADEPTQRDLVKAVRAGEIDLVKVLIRNGAAVAGDRGYRLAGTCGSRGDHLMMRCLVEAGLDAGIVTNRPGGGCLLRAVSLGDLNVARTLMDAGVDPTAIDMNGEGVLFYVRWEDTDSDFVELVLGLGLDVDRVSTWGNTPLIRAVHRRDAVGVRLLLAHGADPTLRGKDGFSALDHAEQRRLYNDGVRSAGGSPPDPEIIRLLIEAITQR